MDAVKEYEELKIQLRRRGYNMRRVADELAVRNTTLSTVLRGNYPGDNNRRTFYIDLIKEKFLQSSEAEKVKTPEALLRYDRLKRLGLLRGVAPADYANYYGVSVYKLRQILAGDRGEDIAAHCFDELREWVMTKEVIR